MLTKANYLKNGMKKCLLTAATAVLLTGSAVANAAKELVVVSWGGAYTASQQKAYHEPYMKNNPGVTIINEDSGDGALAKLRAMNEAGNVTWALIDMIAADAILACDEGLAQVINHDRDLAAAPDGTPASEDFGDTLVSECFIPTIVYSTTFGYRKDLVRKKPKKLKDVFNLKKIPGKRSLRKKPFENLEWALIADGVKAKNVYKVLSTEAGVDRAFAKLDTIKDHIVWWEKGAQPAQLLADGEVVISSGYNGRLFSAIVEEKQPIAMMWDWQIVGPDGWIVPVGGPHNKEVMKYLKFGTDTQRLADQTKYISYGPARKSSAPLVGKHEETGVDMKPHMPTDPKNAKHTLQYDNEFWADNGDDLSERFQAWLAEG